MYTDDADNVLLHTAVFVLLASTKPRPQNNMERDDTP